MARASKVRRALAILSASSSFAMLEPMAHAAAVDFGVSVGVPRIAFTSAGAELARNVTVSAETSLLRLDMSSTFCERSSVAPVFGGRAGCSGDAAAAREGSEGAQAASLTLKLPRWPVSSTGIELALVSWRNGISGGSARGTDAEVRVMQSLRGVEFAFGHSEPLRDSADGAWRSTWIGAGFPLSPRARVQLVGERSYEIVSGARDTRITAILSYALADGLRGNVRLTRTTDDPARPWLASAGLAWTF